MEDLKKITESVLFKSADQKALEDSINAMQELYTLHTGIQPENFTDQGILLPAGMAISPLQAAACLMEVKRTAVFLRGIYKAILQLRTDFPGEKINILYAGCGPYATLVTPFTTLFRPDEIAFYLLDINRESLDHVSNLYTSLGLNDYAKEFICADATTYCLPAGNTIHLIISETMQRTLYQEPQVAIMLNLIPQMAGKTLFIPEEIDINLLLLDRGADMNGVCYEGPGNINLGHVYVIGRDKCEAPVPVVIEMPQQTGKYNSLNLFTDIIVFKDEELHVNDCTLNYPLIIADIAELHGKKIKFHYEMSNTPQFHCEWLQ